MKLKDKAAIIVGVGDPVGRGVALRFAREGARVFVVDADKDAVKEVAAALAGSTPGFATALRSRAEADDVVSRAVEAIGGVDILVNNCVLSAEMTPLDVKSDLAVERSLGELRSALWMMQAVFPRMRAQRWGRIINVGSRYGKRMNVYNAEYGMAVAALHALTRSAAAEWFSHNIVTNLLETAAETPEFAAYRDADPQAVNWLVEQTALGRRGDPVEDIGGAATIMACDEVDWINGQVFYADGGQHIAAPAFIPAVQAGFFVQEQEGIYSYE